MHINIYGGDFLHYFGLLAAAVQAAVLFSCVQPEVNDIKSSNSVAELSLQDESVTPSEIGYIPLNYENQTGKWFPYMDYAYYMQNKSEDEFRNEVAERFAEAKNKSVNTVYVHVRPCGDAYYKSSIFPSGMYLDGDYDPLQIMIEVGHSAGLSVHAWINPLRCQTEEQLEQLSDDYIVKRWAENRDDDIISVVNGRYYLNPAYDEVIDLICRETDEIIRNYDVDGIHIDDYFYPTTDIEFDKISFDNSGSNDLAAWRRENCNKMIRAMYESIKNADENVLFGISPQGNIDIDYNTQYADVNLWCGTGYCDYIVPQLYYGFLNETCPFTETLSLWENMTAESNVRLIIGLAAYKCGSEDKWAGATGQNEWIDNPQLIEQEIETVNNSSADGYALYEKD